MRKLTVFSFCAALSVLCVAWVACGWWDGTGETTTGLADSLKNQGSYVSGDNFLRTDVDDTTSGDIIPSSGLAIDIGSAGRNIDTIFVSTVFGSMGSFLNDASPQVNHMGSVGIAVRWWQWAYIDTALFYRVGIGADTPSEELHIADSSTPVLLIEDLTNNCQMILQVSDVDAFFGSKSNHPFYLGTNWQPWMTIAANGDITIDTNTFFLDESANRIGIGTITPSCMLELEHASASKFQCTRTGGAAIIFESGTSSANLGTSTNHDLHIVANDLAKLTVKADGKVGIGEVAPSQLLDVDGNIDCDTIFGVTNDVVWTVAALMVPDTLATGTVLTPPITPPTTLVIDSLYAVVNTAPTGDSIVIRVDKNGASIHSSTVFCILATATTSNTVVPDVTSATWKDLLTIDLAKVGSTLPGIDLTVFVLAHYVQ